MISDSDKFWNVTFIPGTSAVEMNELIKRVRIIRQARFNAVGLKLMAEQSEICRELGFRERFNEFQALSQDERKNILNSPLFIAWLKEVLHNINIPEHLRESLAFSDWKAFLNFGGDLKNRSASVKVEDSDITISRFNINGIVARLAAPEYILPDTQRQLEFDANVIYPRELFQAMVTVALDRIKYAWPEAYRDFAKTVRVIVDMIDGEHTSYSACEHTGMIFVSTDNSPLVALEEFLIHEFGHQILYYVMELDPIVVPSSDRMYKLPWSGNERDLYGYFHAFYIYILMANFLTRVKYRSRREQRRVDQRFNHVLRGLLNAVPELQSAEGYTEYGRRLLDMLVYEVNKLHLSQPSRITSKPTVVML